MKLHFSAVGKTDSWITPKYITEVLGLFDLDPCAHTEMPWSHARVNYTINDDGLNKEWFGRVWLNPPFDQRAITPWFKKMSEHKKGIMLVSAAFETNRFKTYVWGKNKGILLLNHRPYFCLPSGKKGKANSGQTMCLIAYTDYDLQILLKSGLGYPVKEIKNLYAQAEAMDSAEG